jgi:hypothetical protein
MEAEVRRRQTRILPIVEEIERTGPKTVEEIVQLMIRNGIQTHHRAFQVKRWADAGWLVELADGRYGTGHKAKLPRSRAEAIVIGDQSQVEGTDEWLVVQQLAHGKLSTRAIADILDCSTTKALAVVHYLVTAGHVMHVGHGVWDLV